MKHENLFGWNSQSWQLLDQWGILLGLIASITTLLGIMAAILAFIKRDSIRRWFTTNRFPNVEEGNDQDEHWEGILFTVSHPQTPEWVIKTSKPKAIAMLGTEKSREAVESVAKFARQRNISVLDPIYLVDPDSPEEAKRESKHLLERMRNLGLKNLSIDVTGGKTPMSLGAFMAAEESLAATVYVTTEYDSQLKKPVMSTASLTTISDPG